ncbi:hypothetical protein K1X13_08440 [Nocardioides sp. WL0053]|uniref:GDSL-like lipase/acylhydrolase family protein n=1 Tax=Nocardioides jiangsuensis TaxID=2866161 RepID=A0ABS7RJD1_9ACTN|nr:hypothetical protein [Nocardioides jiangsuensis]MBY9074846.1 hypothetical protein [Nocardioides jiangsuensis]
MRSQSQRRRTRGAVLGVLTALLTALGGLALTAPPAAADGPGVGTPWVVTVGDSYISGEAGRWAGSSNASTSYADALGPTAYYDNAAGTGEQINRCHRSRSAEAFVGGGVSGLNLACSGARTATFTDGNGYFKPGLDFYDDGAGRIGQAKALQQFAAGHNVTMVVVSIGGNDFNFGSIVQTCVSDFLSSSSWFKNYCNDDSSVTSNFTSANVAAVKGRIATAYQNVRTAMRNAGYADGAWTMLVQNYPSPLPRSTGIRYGESGYTRQNTGGCGFWNADLNWANDTALPTINSTVVGAVSTAGIANSRTLDLSAAFNGRRLCESTVGLYEEKGLTSWTQAGAVDKTEWVNQIRTVSTVSGPYFVQESLHPNYWAQMATRSCVRQAYNGGTPRSGACSISATGLLNGEPRMTLR